MNVEELLNRNIFFDLNKENISDRHLKEIDKILEVYDNKSIKNRLKNIYYFIKYDVEGDWLERINIIRTVLKTDVMSDYALEIRYGKDNVNILKKELNKKVSHTLENYINKYGEEEGKLKFEEYLVKSKTPWGLSACIDRYGEEEGNKKWEERLNKKIDTQNKRKEIKPYRNGRTLKDYQNRYGLEHGYKLWNIRNKRQSYRFSLDFYIEKYGEIEGVEKWDNYRNNMDKTSKKSFICRYGEPEGTEKYEKYIERMSYINTLEYFIEKYGESNGLIKYEEVLTKKICSFPGYSKVSQELFWLIYDEIVEIDKKNVYFAELNQEYMYFIHEKWCKAFSVDFKLGYKIIEFDGDYWHSSDKQKDIDNKRDTYLINNGYEVLRVKEYDFRNNKNVVLNKCINFLK